MPSTRQLNLAEKIDRYEAALAAADFRSVDVSRFTPHPTDVDYWPALVELLRIRMEQSFKCHDRRGVASCLEEFPQLPEYPELFSQLAYEEYRLRKDAGELVAEAEYQQLWHVDISSWHGHADEVLLTQVDWEAAIHHKMGEIHSIDSACQPVTSRGAELPAAISSLSGKSRRAALTCGDVFGPFRILFELGRGALARVYLAQQLDLSERPVVLKVSARATPEPQRIAMLQHPHIVQIFSVHEVAGFQVICMPYAGATTLADLLTQRAVPLEASASALSPRTSQHLVTTLDHRHHAVQTLVDGSAPAAQLGVRMQLSTGMTWPDRWRAMRYEDIVCELALQIARGLSHAHQHGIVHSDLKPANVLIGNDGQARLVDFNVSQQLSSVDQRVIGGTLPYMAPEHLQSLRDDTWQAGPSSDLYSLGVIAFQLLSGRLPFATHRGALDQILNQSLTQRFQFDYAYRLTSADASVDVRSIIDKLLAPDAAARYSAADALCEDLERHLQHRPLRHAANRSLKQRALKWSRRHPQLSSVSSVVAIFLTCMLALVWLVVAYRGALLRQQARQVYAEFRILAPQALVSAASCRAFPGITNSVTESTRQLLDKLLAPQTEKASRILRYLDPRERLEIALQLSGIEAALTAQTIATQPSSIDLPHEFDNVNFDGLASQVHGLARELAGGQLGPSASTDDFATVSAAALSFVQGEDAPAIKALNELLDRSSNHPAAWLLLGHCYAHNGDLTLADQAFASSLALLPRQWTAWYSRGLVTLNSAQLSQRKDQFQAATTYFTRALELRPNLIAAHFNRALCHEELGDLEAALSDVNRVIESGDYLVRSHFLKSRLNKKLGQADAAESEFQKALACEPKDAQDFSEMGFARLTSDPQQAARDLWQAHELAPLDTKVLQNMAYLAMETVPNDDDLAQLVLDRWVRADDDSVTAIASRGVFHARHARAEAAQKDAETALQLRPNARALAQIASIHAILASKTIEPSQSDKHKSLALTFIARSLQLEWSLVGELSRDPDLVSLRSDTTFRKLMQTAAALGGLPKLIEQHCGSVSNLVAARGN